jgi:hypothetical protein
MFAQRNQMRGPRFSAGLYWRTKTGMRFLGWGKPWTEKTEASERPWSDLAAWLRMAHGAISASATTSKDGMAKVLTDAGQFSPVQSGPARSGDAEHQEYTPAIGNLAGV